MRSFASASTASGGFAPTSISNALTKVRNRPALEKVLLASGLVSSVWWVVIDILASLRYPDYSYTDQIISELSAEGAPTRGFLLAVNSAPYAVLVGLFGLGVLASTGSKRAGGITGTLVLGFALTGAMGGVLFPMAMRGNEGSLRNAMHVPYGFSQVLLLFLIIGFGSVLFGRRFQYYSYATIAILLIFGTLTGIQSGRMVSDEPTPWMGIEERISVYAAMLWIAVLSIALLRSRLPRSSSDATDESTG